MTKRLLVANVLDHLGATDGTSERFADISRPSVFWWDRINYILKQFASWSAA